MHLHRIVAPEGETDYFFAHGTFRHEDIFYKIAVAEELTWVAEATGSFEVIVQSERGTQHLNLYKWEGSWINNSEGVDIDADIVLAIGAAIDESRPKVF